MTGRSPSEKIQAQDPEAGKTLRERDRFCEQRLALMFTTARSASALAAVAVVVCFAVFAYHGTSPWLWLWLVAVLVTNAGRFVLFRAYQHHRREHSQAFWLRAHMLTGVATGIAWGLLPLHPVDGLPPAYAALLLIIPTFLATGAINAYGIFVAQYRAFLLAVFSSLIACHAWRQGLAVLPTDLVFVFVAGGLLRMARHFQTGLLESMDARVRLEDANARLEQVAVQMAATNTELARQQAVAEQEQALAAHVYRQLVSGSDAGAPGVRLWTQAVGSFSGDLSLVTRGPAGQIYLMLGDFTGHGLPAALGAVPAASVFLAMANKGIGVERIAEELHRRLETLLPVGYFCCAVLAEIDSRTGESKVWNGGLPPVLVRRHRDGALMELHSAYLPLAVGGDDRPPNGEAGCVKLAPGDCLFIFSDGLIEAANQAGEPWGMERLRAVLGQRGAAASDVDTLRETLGAFVGERPCTDDISVIEVCHAQSVWESVARQAGREAMDPASS